MLVAEWTDGEAICDRHGNTLDAAGLKRLRERIRVLSGDTEGSASLEDLARGVARRFPDLPPLPRTTSEVDPLRLTFDELWARLQARHCAVLDGNPVKVTDRSSPLRSMQAKDDYDHAVFIHAARGERAFVMDPLGRGRYEGQWVSEGRPTPVRLTLRDRLGVAVLRRREARRPVQRREAATARCGRRSRAFGRRSSSPPQPRISARSQALRDAGDAVAAVPR